MLLLLAWWILLLAAAAPLGAVLMRAARTGDQLATAEDRFLAQCWLGLLSLAALLLAIAAATPLTPLVSLAVFAALAIGPRLFPSIRADLRASAPRGWSLAALVAVMAAAALDASGPVTHFDTGLYHYPLIRWLSETGLVPGMSFFHFRLAFSSSWFAAAAAVDFGPWSGHAATVFGGLGFGLLVFQLLVVIRRWTATAPAASDRFAALALPVLLLLVLEQRQQVTPSPNLAAAVGIFLCGWSMTFARPATAGDWNLPVLFAGGAAATKVIAGVALAVAVAGRFVQARRGDAVRVALLGALLAAPLPLANYVASGCPLFPSPALCTAGPSSYGASAAAEVESSTKIWARYAGNVPADATTRSMSWISPWLARIPNMVFLALIAAGTWIAVRRSDFRAPALLGLVGSLAIIATAPDVRFGIGYAAVLLGCVGAVLTAGLRNPIRVPANALVVAAVVVIVLGTIARETVYWRIRRLPHSEPRLSRIILPAPLPVPPYAERRSGDITFHAPTDGELCWAAPRPCTPRPPDPPVRLCVPSQGERAGYCR
jgi:hypothetical protein